MVNRTAASIVSAFSSIRARSEAVFVPTGKHRQRYLQFARPLDTSTRQDNFIYVFLALTTFLVLPPIADDLQVISDFLVRLIGFSCLLAIGVRCGRMTRPSGPFRRTVFCGRAMFWERSILSSKRRRADSARDAAGVPPFGIPCSINVRFNQWTFLSFQHCFGAQDSSQGQAQ